MEVVSEITHRVLAYIDSTERYGYSPHVLYVDAFADDPDRAMNLRYGGGLASYGLIQAQISSMFGSEQVAAETFVEYLTRCGWVDVVERRVKLTQLGRALLRALNAPGLHSETDSVVEIVLSPEDPFAYARAVNALGQVPASMLVDQYFRFDALTTVGELSNIERILTGVTGQHRETLAFALATLENPPEVRTSKKVHDRYLIPSDAGAVLMLGSSLNTIGEKKISSITSLGDVASDAIRDAHEALWRDATLIEPKERPKPAGKEPE